MSYRAFKRLLGETSLERKCRFLLGGVTVLLITGSFWLYAWQTEHLAYDQTEMTGRLLFAPFVDKLHLVSSERRRAMEQFQRQAEERWPEDQSRYIYKLLKPDAKKPEHKADSDERGILNRFLNDPSKNEETRSLPAQGLFYYYGAVRASESCIQCHRQAGPDREQYPDLKVGDLMGLVSIRLSTSAIESGVHVNRALLISTALITALLLMAGCYLIVRYIIVKPVKHLKEVSDAIAAGELNVRSEIHSGDEFEDLSYAFNRMLRNLVSMQESQRKLNGDLDRKLDELARLNMALYESNRLKSDFLATMSHELRTPLHNILGFSDVLLSASLPDKQERWVVNIRTSGQELLALINDILDLAKIEAGKMEVRPEELALAGLCEGLVNQFRPLAEKKRIDLRWIAPEELPPVRQDPVKVRQILVNLLSNAIKFTPEGGRVQLRAAAEGGWILLTVMDTGVGIAPEDREAIFDKFRQGANPMTREQGGSGLGLSIVRELTKLLGGEIGLTSELGRGSTFTIALPRWVSGAPGIDLPLPREPLIRVPERVGERYEPPVEQVDHGLRFATGTHQAEPS